MTGLHSLLDETAQHLAIGLSEINTLNYNSLPLSKAQVSLHLVEEMSELTKEIIKIYVRGKDRKEEFHEELADVILLLDQAVRIADPELLFQKMEYKINRFKERYADGRA